MTGKMSEFDLQSIHEYWVNLDSREVWIHGVERLNGIEVGEEPGVEYVMANKVIKNLHMLRHESAKKPVLIHLHTCGGVWEEGMSIYDTIKMMPYPVTIVSYTHARSMSSLILQAGDKRLMLPNSYFMIHWGTLDVGGEAHTVHSIVNFSKRSDETMLDIYVESCVGSKRFSGKSAKEVRQELEALMDKKGDVYLSAEEAVEWGFADGILTSWNDLYSKQKRN
jgi:ATP-dependent protease ClpP protease subunit